MKPIVYLHKEQFIEAAVGANGEILYPVAYEWQGELVLHAYIDKHQHKTGGMPVSCFLKYIKSIDEISATVTFFEKVLPETINNPDTAIGFFVFEQDGIVTLEGYCKSAGIIKTCDVHTIPGKEELYSRSKGLLETAVLANKKVLIIGLGSFGSHIAVELAKAGVGMFTLVDFDRIELSNVTRHVCGVNELGRLKTYAMKDAILLKNPFAVVSTVEADINCDVDLLHSLIQDADITICVTDNNRSRFNINMLAVELDKVVLFGRAITRAEAGDVFRLNGNKGPCYCCLVGNDALSQSLGSEEISSRKQADELLPAYTAEEDKEAVVQVGLSSDIFPICNLLVKLALVELSKNSQSGLSDLGNELSYDSYLWVNRRERQYTNWNPFNQSENKPTILKWYGVRVPKAVGCMGCLNSI
jgi:molybdopterin-synthase adenylyltransferase